MFYVFLIFSSCFKQGLKKIGQSYFFEDAHQQLIFEDAPANDFGIRSGGLYLLPHMGFVRGVILIFSR